MGIKVIGCIATFLMAGAGVATFSIGMGTQPEGIVEELSTVIIKPEEAIDFDEIGELAPTSPPLTEPDPVPISPPEPSPAAILVEESEKEATELSTPTEYWAKYAGVCPEDQPKDSIFWEQSRYLAFARHADYQWPTFQHYVNTYWNFYMLHGYTGTLRVSTFANLGYENNMANQAVGLWIDYENMTIYQASMNPTNPWTNIPQPFWDRVTTEANAYLKQLDARYHAECSV